MKSNHRSIWKLKLERCSSRGSDILHCLAIDSWKLQAWGLNCCRKLPVGSNLGQSSKHSENAGLPLSQDEDTGPGRLFKPCFLRENRCKKAKDMTAMSTSQFEEGAAITIKCKRQGPLEKLPTAVSFLRVYTSMLCFYRLDEDAAERPAGQRMVEDPRFRLSKSPKPTWPAG